MAITNLNSNSVGNVIAPSNQGNARNNNYEADGVLRTALGLVTNAADDSATSVHRAVRVPSNANIRSIKLSTGDATTAGAIDIGVYYSADNDADATGTGAVIDVDLFASALDLTGGPFVKAEQIDESGEYTYTEQTQPLWQAAGLSSDPGGYLDVTATITTTYNGAAVGQLYEVQYVV